MHRSIEFFLEIVDFIVLDVCSKSKSCQKNCSERQKLLKVVRTTRSFSQRRTLLKSFREQSGQALSEGRKQEYVKFWGSGDTCCLMIWKKNKIAIFFSFFYLVKKWKIGPVLLNLNQNWFKSNFFLIYWIRSKNDFLKISFFNLN